MTWLIKALFIEIARRKLAAQVQAWKPGEADYRTLQRLSALEAVIRRHS